jgi:hypothetical protein
MPRCPTSKSPGAFNAHNPGDGGSGLVQPVFRSPARAAQFAREEFRGLTMADLERQAEQMPWGTAAEVTERIIEAAESAGADNVQISLNRGVLPHAMFMEQIRRFARDVLPALQAHRVERVPLAEEVPA